MFKLLPSVLTVVLHGAILCPWINWKLQTLHNKVHVGTTAKRFLEKAEEPIDLLGNDTISEEETNRIKNINIIW